MNKIIVATDFSRSSLNAVRYAADLANSIKAELVIFHAIPFPIAVSEISLPESSVDDMFGSSNLDLEKLKEEMSIRAGDRLSISTVSRLGYPEKQIEMISAELKPLAVVMGIKSEKTLEKALMGSSVFHAMNHADFPTLIIPENAAFKEIKKIAVACDLQRIDEKLPFKAVSPWIKRFNASLDIINVSARGKDFKAAQVAGSISVQNAWGAFKPNFHFLTGDNIAGELNSFTKIHDIDLLVVFPRNHGIFNFFYKKNSKSIVTENQIPILSVHEAKV